MKLLVGVALGALGMWAYRTGRLERWLPNMPESVQQQLTHSHSAPAHDIVMPSAAEVAGRPGEPLPVQQP